MEKTETKKKYLLLKLFFSTLYISSFTFGGGFVIVTFMKRKFVDEQKAVRNGSRAAVLCTGTSYCGVL